MGCCIESSRPKQRPQEELIPETKLQIFANNSLEHLATQTLEDTRDDDLADELHCSFISESLLHTSKHNRSKTVSYFDSTSDFASEDLSQEDGNSPSKEQMKASLEKVAIRLMKNSPSGSDSGDEIDKEVNRVLESFCESNCLNRTQSF